MVLLKHQCKERDTKVRTNRSFRDGQCRAILLSYSLGVACDEETFGHVTYHHPSGFKTPSSYMPALMR